MNKDTDASEMIENLLDSKSVHDVKDDKQLFKFETLGGDASLLHLAQQIDRGIQRKLKEKESETAKRMKKAYATF